MFTSKKRSWRNDSAQILLGLASQYSATKTVRLWWARRTKRKARVKPFSTRIYIAIYRENNAHNDKIKYHTIFFSNWKIISAVTLFVSLFLLFSLTNFSPRFFSLGSLPRFLFIFLHSFSPIFFFFVFSFIQRCHCYCLHNFRSPFGS